VRCYWPRLPAVMCFYHILADLHTDRGEKRGVEHVGDWKHIATEGMCTQRLALNGVGVPAMGSWVLVRSLKALLHLNYLRFRINVSHAWLSFLCPPPSHLI